MLPDPTVGPFLMGLHYRAFRMGHDSQAVDSKPHRLHADKANDVPKGSTANGSAPEHGARGCVEGEPGGRLRIACATAAPPAAPPVPGRMRATPSF